MHISYGSKWYEAPVFTDITQDHSVENKKFLLLMKLLLYREHCVASRTSQTFMELGECVGTEIICMSWN